MFNHCIGAVETSFVIEYKESERMCECRLKRWELTWSQLIRAGDFFVLKTRDCYADRNKYLRAPFPIHVKMGRSSGVYESNSSWHVIKYRYHFAMIFTSYSKSSRSLFQERKRGTQTEINKSVAHVTYNLHKLLILAALFIYW